MTTTLVTVRYTRTVKAGTLDLSVSEDNAFVFESDTAATEFCLAIKDDPTLKVVGYKGVYPCSVNANLANLAAFKSAVDASF